METLSISPYILALLFFIIAFAYSSVGLGGGSSYTALMAIFGMNILAIPMISLALNLLVTTVGSVNFIRNRHARLKLITPFLLSSIPMAYLGGALDIPTQVFYWVLLISLIFVATRIYFWQTVTMNIRTGHATRIVIAIIAGSVLGLIAGITGIGGGIYLVPLIIILGLGTEKEAAACGAIFIWVNSCAGLVSRWQYNPIDFMDYIALILAALAGGALGSFMGSFKFSPKTLEKMLGVIILVAILILLPKVVTL